MAFAEPRSSHFLAFFALSHRFFIAGGHVLLCQPVLALVYFTQMREDTKGNQQLEKPYF
jgi:hypothetical protein